jgi:hypothetical protein
MQYRTPIHYIKARTYQRRVYWLLFADRIVTLKDRKSTSLEAEWVGRIYGLQLEPGFGIAGEAKEPQRELAPF